VKPMPEKQPERDINQIRFHAVVDGIKISENRFEYLKIGFELGVRVGLSFPDTSLEQYIKALKAHAESDNKKGKNNE
jgi:pyruvate formate-lyase activating enzyme-like uncharacterized protein